MCSAKKRSMTERSVAVIKAITRVRLRLMCCGIIPIPTATVFFEAEAGGEIDKAENDDTKLASSELTLKNEINFAELVKAQIEYTRKKAKEGTAGGNDSNLIGGGYGSNLIGGDLSLIIGRNECSAKGGIHSVIVLMECKCDDKANYVPIAVKAEIVDGVRIKADTWYKLKDGEFVEVDV